jgi:MFS family permease
MNSPDLPAKSAYPWYLTSSSLWMAGMSLQGFLFTWLLVGVLERPADEVGYARSLSELPPLLMLLIGGYLGDRFNARTYLTGMHLLMAVPPLLLAYAFKLGALGYWIVVAFGISMAAVQALSDPARQAALSRVIRIDIQRGVTIMTIFGSLVGVTGFYVGGQLDVLGLETVLLIQAALFLVGLAAVRCMPDLPPQTLPARQSRPLQMFTAGFAAVWRTPLVRNLIGLNFMSSLFNAGAYIIAIPFIVTELYAGDATLLSKIMIVFTVGSVGSNVLLLFFLPLNRPGRLFLLLQLTRIAILMLVWIQPDLWLLFVAILGWGLNMGLTTTLVRTIVQELAPATDRSVILSVLLLSFMVSSPISSILLGQLIAGFSPTAALLPGMVISMLILLIGFFRSGLWQYQANARATPLNQTRPANR